MRARDLEAGKLRKSSLGMHCSGMQAFTVLGTLVLLLQKASCELLSGFQTESSTIQWNPFPNVLAIDSRTPLVSQSSVCSEYCKKRFPPSATFYVLLVILN